MASHTNVGEKKAKMSIRKTLGNKNCDVKVVIKKMSNNIFQRLVSSEGPFVKVNDLTFTPIKFPVIRLKNIAQPVVLLKDCMKEKARLTSTNCVNDLARSKHVIPSSSSSSSVDNVDVFSSVNETVIPDNNSHNVNSFEVELNETEELDISSNVDNVDAASSVDETVIPENSHNETEELDISSIVDNIDAASSVDETVIPGEEPHKRIPSFNVEPNETEILDDSRFRISSPTIKVEPFPKEEPDIFFSSDIDGTGVPSDDDVEMLDENSGFRTSSTIKAEPFELDEKGDSLFSSDTDEMDVDFDDEEAVISDENSDFTTSSPTIKLESFEEGDRCVSVAIDDTISGKNSHSRPSSLSPPAVKCEQNSSYEVEVKIGKTFRNVLFKEEVVPMAVVIDEILKKRAMKRTSAAVTIVAGK